MGVCDAHGALWKSERQMSPGEGYLLAARFMQRSVVQEKLIERDMPMMERTGFTRQRYRQQVEAMQGPSPWLVCEECIGTLKLSQADKQAAREAGKRWWRDKTTPGHVPGSRVTGAKKPGSTSQRTHVRERRWWEFWKWRGNGGQVRDR